MLHMQLKGVKRVVLWKYVEVMIYIVSHSSMDLPHAYALYKKYSVVKKTQILISSTPQNLKVFKKLKIPKSDVRYLNFPSRESNNRKGGFALLPLLISEKRSVDKLVVEVLRDKENQFYFSSYTFDPHMAYAAHKIHQGGGRVFLVDVLKMKPKPIKDLHFFSVMGFKNILSLMFHNMVFGNLFYSGGSKDQPILTFDFKKSDLEIIDRESVLNGSMRFYLPNLVENKPNIIFLYSACPPNLGEQEYQSLIISILERIISRGVNIIMKVHPQCGRPVFLEKYQFEYLDNAIPFEFVEIEGLDAIIGICTAAMIGIKKPRVISLLNLFFEKDTELYNVNKSQLSQSDSILFLDELSQLDSVFN